MLCKSTVASVVTLIVFFGMKWCPAKCDYIKLSPYSQLLIVALLSLSLIIPCAWTQELLPDVFQKDIMKDVFELLMTRTEGFIIISLFAPVVEEVVFRGAILRHILLKGEEDAREGKSTFLSRNTAVKGIVISAALFSLAHGNPAQMPHAFVIGMLLGWIYYRTRSIIPGMVYHWVNNAFAFAAVGLFPQLPYDAKLIEYFGGNDAMLYASLFISSVVSVLLLFLFNKQSKSY